jgi:hypothetical protein
MVPSAIPPKRQLKTESKIDHTKWLGVAKLSPRTTKKKIAMRKKRKKK